MTGIYWGTVWVRDPSASILFRRDGQRRWRTAASGDPSGFRSRLTTGTCGLTLLVPMDWIGIPIPLSVRNPCIHHPREISRETLSPKANSGKTTIYITRAQSSASDCLFRRRCYAGRLELAVRRWWARVWAHPSVFLAGFFCRLPVYT